MSDKGPCLNFYTASGECICEICGKEYWRHPMDWDDAKYTFDGKPILHILCNKDRVKL